VGAVPGEQDDPGRLEDEEGGGGEGRAVLGRGGVEGARTRSRLRRRARDEVVEALDAAVRLAPDEVRAGRDGARRGAGRLGRHGDADARGGELRRGAPARGVVAREEPAEPSSFRGGPFARPPGRRGALERRAGGEGEGLEAEGDREAPGRHVE